MIQTPNIPVEELDFVKPERANVELGYSVLDIYQFDGVTVEQFLEKINQTKENLLAEFSSTTQVLIKDYGDGDFKIQAIGQQSDEDYEEAVKRAYQSAVKQRQNELATLKRLSAKYPNVTFE